MRRAFRMVETWHIAATMRLVDSAAEQDVLEHMLDASKPPPPEAQGIHYLLAAPFRYLPPTGSRFRSPHMPGIWYGADDSYCACAEIAYWRQRFLLDSAGLITQHLSTDHSCTKPPCKAPSTCKHPWSQAAAHWKHPQRLHRNPEAGRAGARGGQRGVDPLRLGPRPGACVCRRIRPRA